MRISRTVICGALLLCALSLPVTSSAQQTYNEMEQLTVNEHVTTVITSSEPIRLVDISTDVVAGDKPIENVIRLKPKEGGHEDGEVLAIVTVVTERFRAQYALVYTTRLEEAVTDKEVQPSEQTAFHNPARQHEHRGHGALCAAYLEQPGQVPSCQHPAPQDGDAAEQYLFRR